MKKIIGIIILLCICTLFLASCDSKVSSDPAVQYAQESARKNEERIKFAEEKLKELEEQDKIIEELFGR